MEEKKNQKQIDSRFYQIEWSNGNTDVFTDMKDAEEGYKDDFDLAFEYVMSEGFFTESPTNPNSAEWSDKALEKAIKLNLDIKEEAHSVLQKRAELLKLL